MQKTRFAIGSLTLLIFGQLPMSAIAAPPCSLSGLDTVAGLGTQITIAGCPTVDSLSLHGPSGITYTQKLSLDASGNGVTLIPSTYTKTAGAYNVKAADVSTSFTVIADRADDARSTFSASPASIRGNGEDAVTVTAVLRDKFDNPVSGRPIALISSRASDDVNGLSVETDENGRMMWTVRGRESGAMTLIPYDIISAKQLSLRAGVTVLGGSANTNLASLTSIGGESTAADLTSTTIDRFELSLPQDAKSVKANELFSMNVRAMNGTALVRGYIGTLIVESSDSNAEFPKKGEDPNSPETGRIDMRSVDQGERNLALTFVLRKIGQQTITVYDKLNPNVKGSITISVSRDGSSTQQSIVIKDPTDRTHIKGGTVKLQGTAPSLVNLKVKGGETVVLTETDAEGIFRVDVPLNPADKEVTLFVVSESGTMESEPVHLIIDNDPPKIDTATIDPAEGKTEQPALLTVKTEPGLTSVTADFNGALLTLTEAEGSYTTPLTAPKAEGIYDISITATDSVGNASTTLMKWTVKPKQMPVVTGVQAESKPLQVALSWDKITTSAIAEYKIYIANEEDPGNVLYSISTKKPVTTAVIKDLPLGITYQFSLTAVSPDGEESAEKSEPVAGSPIGMQLSTTSGEDALLLSWSTIKDLPLDHYVLEYGTDVGEYTEKRTINGASTSFMLRDLLKDITYHLKLTPVTVTGKTMNDLAAVTSGTPGGKGFSPGSADPVPSELVSTLHPGANLPPPTYVPRVSETPRSGIPSMVGAVLVLSAIGGMLLWRSHRKNRKIMNDFLSLMENRYHS